MTKEVWQMSIVTCPKCKMRVIPKPDGTCPSCQAVIGQKPPPDHPVRVKQPPADISLEQQEKITGGKKPPVEKVDIDIKETYHAYIQKANEITRRSTLNILVPFLAVAILILLGRPLVNNYLAPKLAWAEIDKKYSPNTDLMLGLPQVQAELYAVTLRLKGKVDFWGGILAIPFPILGLILTQRRMSQEATRAGRSMRGFKAFFQRDYGFIRKGHTWGRYWPKNFPSGGKREEFLRLTSKGR